MELIKNIDRAVPVELKNLVDYQKGGISSLSLTKNEGVGITIMAVDEGEGLSTHAAGGDAMAYLLEGEALITVDGVEHLVKAGEAILMPVGIPHSLKATKRFKFLLTVVFPPKE